MWGRLRIGVYQIYERLVYNFGHQVWLQWRQFVAGIIKWRLGGGIPKWRLGGGIPKWRLCVGIQRGVLTLQIIDKYIPK